MGQARQRGTREQRVEQAQGRKVGVPVNLTAQLQRNFSNKRSFRESLFTRLTRLFRS